MEDKEQTGKEEGFDAEKQMKFIGFANQLFKGTKPMETTPPLPEGKDYEQEIKDEFGPPFAVNDVDGRGRLERDGKADGARWFRDTIHLPEIAKKDEQHQHDIKAIQSARNALMDVTDKFVKSATENAKKDEEIEKLREFVKSVRDDWENVSEEYQIKAEQLLTPLKPKE